jgi:hypothetical protein
MSKAITGVNDDGAWSERQINVGLTAVAAQRSPHFWLSRLQTDDFAKLN